MNGSILESEGEEPTSPVFALSRPSRTTRAALPVVEAPTHAPSEPSIDLRLIPKLGVGTVGPYDLALELASGGMATVYLAVHDMKSFRVPVAVKRIHPHLAKSREFTDMFADEARIASAINHPHVSRVFDFGKADGSYFIAMEFLAGKPLARVFRALDAKLLAEPRHAAIVCRLMAGLAEGLHAAHTLKDASGAPLGVVHRDVTPQNLFVLADGSVRVTDFGIAWARVRTHHTATGRIKGQLSYLSPEQLNQAGVDARSDIWSLGVVAWEMLTGRRLFRAESEGDAVLAVLTREIPPPSRFAPNVPPELDQIVLRAITRDREQRFASARELARALEGFLSKLHENASALDVEAWLERLFPGHAAYNAELVARAIEMPPLRRASTAKSDPPHVESKTPTAASPPTVAAIPQRAQEPAWRRRAKGAVFAAALASTITFTTYRLAQSAASVPQRSGLHRAAPSTTDQALANHAFGLAHADPAAPLAARGLAATLRAQPAASEPAAETGSVRIDTKNGEASVLVDGHTLGSTPTTVELAVGAHTLLLAPLSGGAPVPVNVRVDRDAMSLVTVALPSNSETAEPASSLGP